MTSGEEGVFVLLLGVSGYLELAALEISLCA